MKIYVAVGIGGVLGTILRYIISLIFFTEPMNSFPWATFSVNLTGAFLLTWIIFQPFFTERLSPTTFLALTTGLLGSYTTFSTLILEFSLLLKQNRLLATTYLTLTILGGIFASFLGYILSKKRNKSGATS